MAGGLTLPLRFDPERLARDLAQLAAEDWAPHYNAADYGGRWRGAALRSPTGAASDLQAVAVAFHDTPLLDRCPYFREVLAAFDCPVKSARLLSLEPGSFIREHSDDGLRFADGEARIHVPIETNPGVEFYVESDLLRMDPGGAYYVDVHLPHRVNNRGESPRVHLVIDAVVNDRVRDLFACAMTIDTRAPRADGVEAFRDAALADRALAAALRGADDFARDAIRLAGGAGFDVHENDVDAMLRKRPRPGPPGGLPIAASVRDGAAFVEWIDAGEAPLDAPFFEDSVRALLRNAYVRFSRRESRLPAPDAPKPPAGLIFHTSRCGSTLVARMLSAAGVRVLSEPPPLDAMIQAGRADWVRSIADALGAGERYVVKLDAWHLHAAALLREAFPETPCVFLYRDPVEVLVSHGRSPGRHMLPGGVDPRALGLELADITAIPREEWPARVLAGIFEAALDLPGDALFVDYRELPGAVVEIARAFRVDADRDRIMEAARVDAKRPAAEFAPDSAAKQVEGEGLRDLVAGYDLDRLYGELRRRQLSAFA